LVDAGVDKELANDVRHHLIFSDGTYSAIAPLLWESQIL
jgi:hypothetical protein